MKVCVQNIVEFSLQNNFTVAQHLYYNAIGQKNTYFSTGCRERIAWMDIGIIVCILLCEALYTKIFHCCLAATLQCQQMKHHFYFQQAEMSVERHLKRQCSENMYTLHGEKIPTNIFHTCLATTLQCQKIEHHFFLTRLLREKRATWRLMCKLHCD